MVSLDITTRIRDLSKSKLFVPRQYKDFCILFYFIFIFLHDNLLSIFNSQETCKLNLQ